MKIREISFKGDKTTNAAHITGNGDIENAIEALGISHPKPVIVLVGGAGGIGWWDKFPMSKATRIVARLAEETGAVVVDGGTQAGVMAEIGKQRKRYHYSFPLVGVVFDNLLTRQDPGSVLDPNHTHFFLIPGNDWGDESAWISRIATAIAGDQKSLTVLVNGGDISRTDVEYSLLENRPTVVMRGTGRMADEITPNTMIVPIKITRTVEDILAFLRERMS
jgi:hypothetical protein